MKKINMRTFNRNMYECLKSLPLVVINARTGGAVFYVISPREVDKYAVRSKNANKQQK